MKNLFPYFIMACVIIIDIIIFYTTAMYILSLDLTLTERIEAAVFYILGCLIVLVLTTDVAIWVERETHK